MSLCEPEPEGVTFERANFSFFFLIRSSFLVEMPRCHKPIVESPEYM